MSIYINDNYDHMEMPAPCSLCGEVQELNDFRSAYARNGALVCDDCHESEDLMPNEQGWTRVSGCTCNAVFCGPGSGHESYCGWEEG